MKTSENYALESIALLNEVQETYESPAGYKHAIIPEGNGDMIIQAPTCGELYSRVMEYLAESQKMSESEQAMLDGFVRQSQSEALNRIAV